MTFTNILFIISKDVFIHMGALHHLLYNLSFNKNDFELFVLEHCNVAYLMANVLHDAGLS